MSLIGNEMVFDDDIEGGATTISFFSSFAFNEALGRPDAIAYHCKLSRLTGTLTSISFYHRWGNDGLTFPRELLISTTATPGSPLDVSGDTGTANLGRYGQAEARVVASTAFSAHLTIIACTRTR